MYCIVGLLILGGKIPVSSYKDYLDSPYTSYLFVSSLEEEYNYSQSKNT